jgi:hypothetical protein
MLQKSCAARGSAHDTSVLAVPHGVNGRYSPFCSTFQITPKGVTIEKCCTTPLAAKLQKFAVCRTAISPYSAPQGMRYRMPRGAVVCSVFQLRRAEAAACGAAAPQTSMVTANPGRPHDLPSHFSFAFPSLLCLPVPVCPPAPPPAGTPRPFPERKYPSRFTAQGKSYSRPCPAIAPAPSRMVCQTL